MKIYYLNYTNAECGQIEAFGSKSDANRRKTAIHREQREYEKSYKKRSEAGEDVGYECAPYDQLPEEVYEIEFPISKTGVIAAFEAGANLVTK